MSRPLESHEDILAELDAMLLEPPPGSDDLADELYRICAEHRPRAAETVRPGRAR